ncbi:MAG: hypothetical protein WCT35_07390 [Sideroxydans sp.]
MSTLKIVERKIDLPVFVLSETCDEDDEGALTRPIKQGIGREALTYFYRPFVDSDTGARCNYNLFPIAFNRDGSPWDLACLYILDKLEGETLPNMESYGSIAEDLGAFKEWIDSDDHPGDLLFHFPKFKQARVTYRYREFLQSWIYAQEVKPKTAQRRMGTVIAFYRWLMEKQYFKFDFSPWEERTYNLSYKNKQGFSVSKNVITTNLSIKTPETTDPFNGTIMDGGELRPLPEIEQRWVFDAAKELGNPEIYLILLFIVLTGARIQTVGTLRRRHFANPHPKLSKSISGGGEVVKITAGPGTGIDTKNDKKAILMVPKALYDVMHSYALSPRTRSRCSHAPGGDHLEQHLFLTQQGTHYFESKETTLNFNPEFKRRHHKKGGTVRQYLKDRLIPMIQERHDKNFHFRVHDLRATFGMNTEAKLVKMVQAGVITLDKARQILRTLMWHESSATTDQYLDYRAQMERIFTAVNEYGDQVQAWIDTAKNGFKNE